MGQAARSGRVAGKRRLGPPVTDGVVAVQNYNNVPYDFLMHGDRRQAERRQENLDRRGVLRWDPQMQDRRLGKDRRQTGAVGRGR